MSEPIRVLHVLQRMEAGGTQALLMNIYRNIDRKKVQFDFLVEYSTKQFYDDEIKELGGKIYYTTVREDYNIIKFNKDVKKVLIENNYKIIHVHTYSIGYFVLKIAEKCGVPVRIAHSHNNETVRDKKYILKKILQKIYPIYATDLFACSEEAGKYLFGNKEFKVLNNAIDTSKFQYNEETRIKTREELGINNNFVVGHVGRLHEQKNQMFLIEIFNELLKVKPNAELLIIGNGPLESQLKEKCQELKIDDKIMFLGNRSDVADLYQAMDVFVLPSLFEGLGIVAVESQAAGTPILCSDKLPKEVEITELLKKKSLEDNAEEWAKESIRLALVGKKRGNMKNEIINAGFDILSVANDLQQYYLEKYNMS